MKLEDIPPLTKKQRERLKKLSKRPDSEIDYSDIPPLDFEKLGTPQIGKFYRPFKKLISIRLDSDVLAWFKHAGEKYQTLINQACREFMENHREDK